MQEFVTPRFMDSSISQDDVAAHLRVYGSIHSHLFNLAKRHVYYDDQDILWPTPEGKLYLRRSVYRFRAWISKVLRPKFEKFGDTRIGLEDHEIPPYDVMLVLHAFMLHPRAFYSDTIRLFPELSILNGFPLAQFASLIDDTTTYVPKEEQVVFWETTTEESFAVPLFTSPSDTFRLSCPNCNSSFTGLWLEDSDDKLGSNLVAPCKECNLIITELAYGAAIFTEDVRRAKSGKGVALQGPY
ncbi:hypothetical protein CPB84DRAFT_1967462 [Gymnopilus junonius]|uniref:Uncharacterized protein n=1 Tax=Gymnopilus junonius TaxID=109634 RepID=A0A9P5TF11_GYMJU|nr:hypothetical protein CPB84DRAFT_1967462 [Gymnopilus junonius]